MAGRRRSRVLRSIDPARLSTAIGLVFRLVFGPDGLSEILIQKLFRVSKFEDKNEIQECI